MDESAQHPDAPLGKAGKYARIERERRFLLSEVPSGPPSRRVRIEDRYLRGTRLRLRRMTDLGVVGEGGHTVSYKLTQKIPTAAGTPGLITTMYLSVAEYDTIAGIDADVLTKVRSSYPPLGVDAFGGPLAGLILAEAEFETAAEELAFRPPVDVVAEVTADLRFTGGRLVSMSVEETRDLLAGLGIG